MNKPRKQPRANPAFAGLGPLKEKCPTPQGDYPRTNPAGSPPLRGGGRPAWGMAREKSPSAGGRQEKIRASVALALAVAPAMREAARRELERA